MKKQSIKILSMILIVLFITLTPISSYIGINTASAEVIALTGLGVKLVATILASLGVLSFINDTIGVESFYTGLIDYVETVKEVSNFSLTLINIATSAIINGVKAKVGSIVGFIREYYNMIKDTLVPDPPLVPNLPNAKASYEESYSGTKGGISTAMKTVVIGNGYEYRYRILDSTNAYAVLGNMYYNDAIVSGYKIEQTITTENLGSYYDNIRFRHKIQITDNSIVFNWDFVNYTKNKIKNGVIVKDIEPLVGLMDLPNLPEIEEMVIPLMKSVPINITFPWDLGIDSEDVLGIDIDSLLEVINNLQLEEYLDKLMDLPKSIIDAMNPAEILVEDGVITGYYETTWDDVLAEGKEHTTILERIADRIDFLIDKIDDFFNPENNPPGSEDDKGTDWGNFKSFFDIFWIFYYLIIIAIIILLKFFNVIMSILSIPANTALFDEYPTMLSGLNYIKNIKVGGLNVTLQTIFEYMFTVFFFLYIVTTLQKLYHTFMGIERQAIKEVEREKKLEIYDTKGR